VSTRLMPPGRELLEADVTRPSGRGRRYRVGRDGTVAPRDDHDARVLRESGWTSPSVAPTTGGRGRRCTVCGFAAWFSRCGRCGGECVKEARHDG
jgi:hypothetical protein